MINEETIWESIWPVVERTIAATLAEDEQELARWLAPAGQAADMLDLFGFPVFDILLKTVLGREHVGLVRAIESEDGRFVHIEYAWLTQESEDQRYTAADVVAVRLIPDGSSWLVDVVNPTSVDLPLTEIGARGIIASSQLIDSEKSGAPEPWVLPLALYAGVLQLPLRDAAFTDDVEQLFLHGLQKRAFGVMSILRSRRLWRDFRETADPSLDPPAAWAAAVEFIMSEQGARQTSQAAVSKLYRVNLATIALRIKQIKRALAIQDLDERYTDVQTTQIIYDE